MANRESAELSLVFQALADPTRRSILMRLSKTNSKFGQFMTVTELAKPYKISFPAVSKHLKVLKHAGLVASKRRGKTINFAILSQPIVDVDLWMQEYTKFWNANLDKLESILNSKGRK